MKLSYLALVSAYLALVGCVTMSDFENSQSKLKENAAKQKVYSNAEAAGRATAKKCQKPTNNSEWEITISHNDLILKQGGDVVGYFQTLCFKKSTESKVLEIVGIHAGGGMGKAFFMLPRISIFDEQWKLAAQNFSQIKQNAFSGNLEAKIDLKKLPSGNYIMVVEADNRSGKQGIGEYAQATYAVVPIITSVDMYSLPTGKARLYLK